MAIIYTEPKLTESKKYKGEATATDSEIKDAGGEKTLQINNHLFQSDADAQSIADALLTRLKTRKQYFEASIEFCPVPIERDDTVIITEYISPSKSISHQGLVRQVKLSITPQAQTLILTLEE